MKFELTRLEVGPWPMNAYLVGCPETRQAAIVDPGADGSAILAAAQGYTVTHILVTHGHADHVGALEQVKAATGAPVYLSRLEAEVFQLAYNQPLEPGATIELGAGQLQAIHTPGHTPGLTCLDLGDGRVLVGDAIFVGGPGRTWSAADFTTTMKTMQQVIFQWPDHTRFFPGHGPDGQIGLERPAFAAFLQRGWSPQLFGDVTWSQQG